MITKAPQNYFVKVIGASDEVLPTIKNCSCVNSSQPLFSGEREMLSGQHGLL